MLAPFAPPAQLLAAGLILSRTHVSRSQHQLNLPTSFLRRASLRPGRSYQHALVLLESLQSNRAVADTISSSSRDVNLDAMPEMIGWMRKAGYEVDDLRKHGLRCIHVAGTKGKGSVCAMIENILVQYRTGGSEAGYQNLGKIGLYTSPHLLDVRERIRIDGIPISKDLFTRYFFELWDRFSFASATGLKVSRSGETKPGFFRFLTILAFHSFIKEGVETAIIECGIGGEYDSTNILPLEAVTATAITSLGIDHVGMLGDTIEQIAWHKSGIMKKGVPVFTVPQVAAAQEVLEKRAMEKSNELTVVDRLRTLESGDVVLGLAGDFQVSNASLAVAVAASHLRTLGVTGNVPQPWDPATMAALPQNFVAGLQSVLWPGRCQIIRDGNTEWYLDGAHTIESIIVAADWFAENYIAAVEAGRKPTEMMLIFNQQDRDAEALLRALMGRLKSVPKPETSSKESVNFDNLRQTAKPLFGKTSIFRYAAFCTNLAFKPKTPTHEKQKSANPIDLSLQKNLTTLYTKLDRNQLAMTYESIEEAVLLAGRVSSGKGDRIMVLATGSLYLVGGLLKVLQERRIDFQGGMPG